MLKVNKVNLIDVNAWDRLVTETYGRVYSFQQQDGCKDRGLFKMTVPNVADDYYNNSIPEEVNGNEIGVSFKAWLNRDPEQPICNQKYERELDLFWERSFYPNVQMIANDLHYKGLLPAGEYCIEIDW